MISQKMKLGAYAVMGAVAGVVGLAVAGFASASTTLIDLPSTAVADISGYASGVFTDLWVVIALVIGIPLAFYVIRKVIGLFRSR